MTTTALSDYGRGTMPGPQSVEEVLGRYYGRPTSAVSIACSVDDGEVLPQVAPDEYVVGPVARVTNEPTNDYVVGPLQPGLPALPVASTPASAAPAPAAQPAAARNPAAPLPAPPPTPEPPKAAPIKVEQPEVLPPPAPEPAASQSSSMSDDELIADMQAILSGQKVYDPSSGKTVSPADVARERDPEVPRPPSDGHAIFDRIAQSMAYANSYDLGTIDLDNRFADFDRFDDATQRARAKKDDGDASPAPSSARVGPQDFLADLDKLRAPVEGVRQEADAVYGAVSGHDHDHDHDHGDAGCGVPSMTAALASPPVSAPFFDSGEHVLSGRDVVAGTLHVGGGAGVDLTYGDVIAMPDLYSSVDDLRAASEAELREVKRLLDRNTAFYAGGKKDRSLDVSNTEWDRATGGRYLHLAEVNSEHFAPNDLFHDDIANAVDTSRNHKAAWEGHHRRAIEAAQRWALANPSGTGQPDEALIINAFGDHFLTDAFASGHLFNKDVAMAYFRANFYSGSTLSAPGNDFFGRLATQVWSRYPDVVTKMSRLKTVGQSVSVLGFHVPVSPRIDSADMFRRLLVAAAEEEPQKVANFVVKAIHDKLNRDGLRVTNAAGDPEWTTHGDGHADPTTLAIMRRAVKQSAANIVDPAIRVSNLDVTPYLARVWQFAPRLTAASQRTVADLVHDYTNPRSTGLVDASAQVIAEQIDAMISVLTDPSHPRLTPA